MNANLLETNLALLKAKDPGLVTLLQSTQLTEKYIVTPSRSGPVFLSRVLPDGTKKTLHSSYDPAQEASRFVDSCRLSESSNFIIMGLGLGYHLAEIMKRVSSQSRLIVIEKDPELLLLTLTHNNHAALITHPGVSFHVGINPQDLQKALSADKIPFTVNGYVTVAFKPLIDAEIAYYHAISKSLENLFQESNIDLKTQSAFSKSFYNNIIDNLQAIIDSVGINVLKNRLEGIPAIIVSAGPSLDKNISLLKNVQDNVILISVGTALTPLLKNGIEPDFVVAIDPDETMLYAFDLENPPHKTWLLFDPSVVPLIPESYKSHKLVFDSGISLSRWIATHNGEKGGLGKMQSVAHTALKFAQHLGCKPLILTGQDLAFSQYRMHCSVSYFHENQQDGLDGEMTMETLSRKNYQVYSRALVTAPDVFGNTATTTEAMHSYKNLFADELIESILNATEGGIPIPRIQNLCLKEALNSYCLKPIRPEKIKLLSNLKNTSQVQQLTTALQAQAGKLQSLQKNLSDIKSRLLQDPLPSGKIQFVREMEVLYKKMVEDSETTQLLQGYSYSEFLRWNQKFTEIARKSQRCTDEELLQWKFERDAQFIEVLIETTDFMRRAFDKMAIQSSYHKPGG